MSITPIIPKVLIIDDDNDLRYSLKRVYLVANMR